MELGDRFEPKFTHDHLNLTIYLWSFLSFFTLWYPCADAKTYRALLFANLT